MSNGSIGHWGARTSGRLGSGCTDNQLTPVAAAGISNTAKLSEVETEDVTQHMCAVLNATHVAVHTKQTCTDLSKGNAYCWERNESEQLGNGTIAVQLEPVKAVIIEFERTLSLSSTSHALLIGTSDYTTGRLR